MPIAYASAAIYNAEKPIAGVVTDDEGKFSLKIEQRDNKYRLVISFIGYTRYEMSLTPNKSHINLGTITLQEDVALLREVVVSAKEVAQNIIEMIAQNVNPDVQQKIGVETHTLT